MAKKGAPRNEKHKFSPPSGREKPHNEGYGSCQNAHIHWCCACRGVGVWKSVTVLSGSPARYLTPEWKDHRSEIARDQLIKNGTLTKPDSKGNMIFTRDWTASSRTRATEIVMGGRRSSAKAWWIDDIGEFLSESTAGK
jgi:hypothetical protein